MFWNVIAFIGLRIGNRDGFADFYRKAANSRGVTLFELLVVVAILGIFAALLTPAVLRGVDSARQSICMSNLRQIGAAMRLFSSEHNGHYPPQEVEKELFPGHGDHPKWHDVLGPYLEKQVSIKRRRTVWICPADNRKTDVFCSYGMNNRASPFPDNDKRLIPLASLRAPPSKLIYVADTGQNKYGSYNTWWNAAGPTKGANLEFRHMGKRRDQTQRYSSPEEVEDQRGSANFLFFDGHVESLRNDQLTREMFRGE